MQKGGIALMALMCFYQFTEGANKKPEKPPVQWKPQQKSCVAPKEGTCTVSINDVKDGAVRTATCTAAKGSQCLVRLNAAVEIPKIDIKASPKKALGAIVKESTFDVDLPQKEGDATIFTFTPTAGDFRNKEITFVIYKTKNPIGTRLYGKTALAMYRIVEGDKLDSLKQMGEIESTIPPEKLRTGIATVKPDGMVLIPSPVEGVPPVAMAVGTKGP